MTLLLKLRDQSDGELHHLEVARPPLTWPIVFQLGIRLVAI